MSSKVASTRVMSAASSRTSGSSGSVDTATKCYSHPSHIMPTGRRMLYTGPDQTDLFQRVNVSDQGQYIGHTALSQEVTSGAGYLYTTYKKPATFYRMRHERPGEMGWNVPKLLRHSVLPVKIEPGRR